MEKMGYKELSINDYKLSVQALFDEAQAELEPSPRFFGNFGTEHANVAITALISNSKNKICIHTELLHKECYDLTTIENFLKLEGATIDVICPDNKIFTSLDSALFGKDIDVYKGKLNIYQSASSKNIVHFLIGDDRFVRREVSHKNREADVHLFDRKEASEALEAFSTLINKSTKLF